MITVDQLVHLIKKSLLRNLASGVLVNDKVRARRAGGRVRQKPVIGAGVHVMHIASFLPRPRGQKSRQEEISLQAVLVQVCGVPVGRGHHQDASLPQDVEQAPQHQRVRDVNHVELVKTDQVPIFLHQVLRDAHQVCMLISLPKLMQALVDLSKVLVRRHKHKKTP
eukprot:scaffold1311_cov256-Pinguiococcus_pyrenoidosus.AAC.45